MDAVSVEVDEVRTTVGSEVAMRGAGTALDCGRLRRAVLIFIFTLFWIRCRSCVSDICKMLA